MEFLLGQTPQLTINCHKLSQSVLLHAAQYLTGANICEGTIRHALLRNSVILVLAVLLLLLHHLIAHDVPDRRDGRQELPRVVPLPRRFPASATPTPSASPPGWWRASEGSRRSTATSEVRPTTAIGHVALWRPEFTHNNSCFGSQQFKKTCIIS